VLERFGLEWLEWGGMHVRFLHPVYDGDDLTIALAENIPW
jgi:hypothetical protein